MLFDFDFKIFGLHSHIVTFFTKTINGSTVLSVYGLDKVEVKLIGDYKRKSIQYCSK